MVHQNLQAMHSSKVGRLQLEVGVRNRPLQEHSPIISLNFDETQSTSLHGGDHIPFLEPSLEDIPAP